MVLVDSNGLVDVLQNDPQWADWPIAQMRAQAQLQAIAINPVIYTEMSLSSSTLEALDDVVQTMRDSSPFRTYSLTPQLLPP